MWADEVEDQDAGDGYGDEDGDGDYNAENPNLSLPATKKHVHPTIKHLR